MRREGEAETEEEAVRCTAACGRAGAEGASRQAMGRRGATKRKHNELASAALAAPGRVRASERGTHNCFVTMGKDMPKSPKTMAPAVSGSACATKKSPIALALAWPVLSSDGSLLRGMSR